MGGETSIQSLVVEPGVYVLTSSIAGIVEKSKVIDGSSIQKGDAVLAIASNGLHTNGYSLVRLLMEKMPEVKLDKIENITFIEQIMKPHTPYYKAIKGLFSKDCIRGMAHITGGGIEGNLCRVIPNGLCAEINRDLIRILPVFKYIKAQGKVNDNEMLRTFNMGVGFILVVPQETKQQVMDHVNKFYSCYEIGQIKKSTEKISFVGRLNWM